MNKTIWLLITLVMAVSLLFGAFACGAPQPEAKFVWKYQSAETAEMTNGQWDKYFCDEVTRRTNGRLTIEFYPTFGLQVMAMDLVGGLHDRLLEAAFVHSAWTAGSVPLGMTFSLPGLLPNDPDVMREALVVLRPYLDEAYEEKGVVIGGLGFNSAGRKIWTSTKPVRSMADLKGLKIRGASPDEDALIAALGAVPTTVDWSEIYTATERGVVDGFATDVTGMMVAKTYEILKYCYVTKHNPSMFLIGISKEAFDELPADLQKIVKEVGDEAYGHLEEGQATAEARQIEMLINEMGFEFTDAEPAALAIIKKTGDEYRVQWAERMGPPAPEMLEELYKIIPK